MRKSFAILIFFLVSLLFFTSCAAQISGSLKGDGQADLNIYAALEPRMTALIRGLSMASGMLQPGAMPAPILDGPAISASMSAAPGVASVSFKNTAPGAIEGPLKITRIGDFLAAGRANGSKNLSFIDFEQNAASLGGGASSGGRCSVNLSLSSGPEILALISPEISGYLAALMAPLATGEVLTKAEYLALVGSVYGRGIADEIAGAFIRAYIDFPGPVQSVKGGTFSGRRAEFTIPLLDILALETPLSYEVVWR
jgi:hypothetical protein